MCTGVKGKIVLSVMWIRILYGGFRNDIVEGEQLAAGLWMEKLIVCLWNLHCIRGLYDTKTFWQLLLIKLCKN